MSKKGEKNARAEAQQFSNRVRGRTNADIYGGGAFGEGGLSVQRQGAMRRQGQSYDKAADTYHNIINTGGYGDEADSLQSKARTLSDTGGFDPETTTKIRAGYGTFADTGGFSDTDKAAFRRRATSAVPAVYDVLNQEAQRRRSLTGGLGTGGEISQMARQLSQQGSLAATNAEVELADQTRRGKLAGLSGGADFESSLASGKRQGFGAYADLNQNMAQNKLAGAQGMSQLFNISTGEISDIGNKILAEYGLSDASEGVKLQVLNNLARTPGVLDNIQRVGGMVAGGLGAM